MKKNYALIVLAFVSTALFAQQTKKTSNLFSASKNVSNHSMMNTTVYTPSKQFDYHWDTTGSMWSFGDSIEFTYTTTCKVKTKLTAYNGNSLSKDTFMYNGLDLQSEQLSYYWNGMGWDTSRFELDTYNNAWLPTQKITYQNNGNSIDTASIETSTYNTQNKLLTNVYSYYNSGALAFGYSISNSYDNGGKLTSEIVSQYNNGAWVNSNKGYYFYDNNNSLNKVVQYGWDTTNNVWAKTDSIVNITFQFWGGDLESSRPSTYTDIDTAGNQTKDSMFYDAQNMQILRISYTLTNGNWIYASKSTDNYTYDNNNNILEHSFLDYRDGSLTAVYGDKQVYEGYSACSAPAGIANIKKNEMPALYPNPSYGILNIPNHTTVSKIEVFSVYGEKAFSTSTIAESIDLSTISKGIYIVKIYNADKVSTQKIILQ